MIAATPGAVGSWGKHAGDVAQDALGDQLGRRALWGVAREVAAIGCDERHAQVEQDARAVIGGDFDAHAADLVLTAVDEVAHVRAAR